MRSSYSHHHATLGPNRPTAPPISSDWLARTPILLSACLLFGCGPSAGAMFYWLGLGQQQQVPAQFTLTRGPLAIFVDDPDGLLSVPEASTALIEELANLFARNNINHQVVPAERVARLIYSRPATNSWSIRKVGEELGAQQVLYIQVRQFRLRQQPRDPIFQGQWTVAIKVISTERKHNVRLWPKRPEGQQVKVTTPMHPPQGSGYEVKLARRMAKMLARKIAFYFYKHPLRAEQQSAW